MRSGANINNNVILCCWWFTVPCALFTLNLIKFTWLFLLHERCLQLYRYITSKQIINYKCQRYALYFKGTCKSWNFFKKKNSDCSDFRLRIFWIVICECLLYYIWNLLEASAANQIARNSQESLRSDWWAWLMLWFLVYVR